MQPSNHQRRREISALTWSLRPFPAGILALDLCFRPSRPGLVLRQRMSDSVQTVDATKSDKSVGKTSVYQKPDVGSEFWTRPKGKSGPRTLNVWLKSEQKNPRRWSWTPVVEPDSAGPAGGQSSRWKSGPFQQDVANGWNFLSWADHSMFSDWFFTHREPVEPCQNGRTTPGFCCSKRQLLLSTNRRISPPDAVSPFSKQMLDRRSYRLSFNAAQLLQDRFH